MARAKDTQIKVAAAPPKVARTGTPCDQPTDGRTAAMRELRPQTGSRDAAAQSLPRCSAETTPFTHTP
jgi:hypothetical protein